MLVERTLACNRHRYCSTGQYTRSDSRNATDVSVAPHGDSDSVIESELGHAVAYKSHGRGDCNLGADNPYSAATLHSRMSG